MNPEQYHAFSKVLVNNLSADERVVGLIAVGSMAGGDVEPDRWSDHDFFLITQPGHQEAFRRDISWLPEQEAIAFWFRETAHGLKVVYESGHLLEFAVFDAEELNVARVNRYRVLLDRDNFATQVAMLAARTEQEDGQGLEDRVVFGQFLTNLMVAVGRYWRGERLSAAEFGRTYAVKHLVSLLVKYVPSGDRKLLDNVSPLRRFELVYPKLGAELNHLILMPLPAAAVALLALAERELQGSMPEFPAGHVAIARRYFESAGPNS